MNRSRGTRLATILAAVSALTAVEAGSARGQDVPTFPKAGGARIAGEEGVPTPPVERAFPLPWRGSLDNVGYGPLHLASQSPFQSLRLDLAAAAPSTLPRGAWEVRETTAWSKMWGQSEDYLIDFEIVSTTHSITYGATDTLQLELGVVEATRFGGSLDGFVRGFHRAFGIAQDGRDQYPVGAYHFELKGRNGTTIVAPSDRTNSSTEYLYFSVHQTLTAGSDVLPAVSVSLSVKGDLRDSQDLSGNGVEMSGSICFAKRIGDVYAYLSIGMGGFGREEFRGLATKASGSSILAALEWSVLDNVSIVVQQLRTDGVLRNYGALSQASTELSLGVKVEACPGLVVELGLIENIIVFDNSPDFGLHFGLGVRF